MSNRRQEADAWAETHVLDVQPVLHVVSHESDNNALYEEYVRELEGAAARDTSGPSASRTRHRR
jgi:hypothetical protein